MRDGFLRAAAGVPDLWPGNVTKNIEAIAELMQQASDAGVKLLVLPELCLTGYSCQDLFLQPMLAQSAMDGLKSLLIKTKKLDMLTILGMPIRQQSGQYNCAVAIKGGEVLGAAPKMRLAPDELRCFVPGKLGVCELQAFGDEFVPLSPDLMLQCADMPLLTVSIGFNLQAPDGGIGHIIACPSAVAELAGAPDRLRMQLGAESVRRCCAMIMASAGAGESTTDMVYSGRRVIFEHGELLTQSDAFETGLSIAEIDLSFIEAKRCEQHHESFGECELSEFEMKLGDTGLTRTFNPAPFIPKCESQQHDRFEQILKIQTEGLYQRMKRIGSQVALLGVSGGLDSTLAMIIAARAIAKLKLPSTALHAITMPCFGTTDRTKNNAYALAEALGSHLREININDSVTQHFKDIGHDMDTHDAAYENAQARERTQILMDLANMEGGLVVGTGDISELALGWATFNGDHMSMYDVNGGVPKTLMRHIVRHVAETCGDEKLSRCLLDILDTPVSPELLPPKDGQIAQKTEELVGPYELHDFFLYHFVGRHAAPRKIYRMAQQAFSGSYDDQTIMKWLEIFIKRFFSQQFKRNCMPEGPAVGHVSLSPRGSLAMPSDVNSTDWVGSLR